MADFVLDASLSLAWCFEDEQTDFAQGVLQRIWDDAEPVAPALWPLEVANGIRNAERRKRIAPEKGQELLRFLDDLPVRIIEQPGSIVLREVAPLASQHGLTAYDAAYFHLAQQRGLPLATLDSPLRRAAEAADWPVIAPD